MASRATQLFELPDPWARAAEAFAPDSLFDPTQTPWRTGYIDPITGQEKRARPDQIPPDTDFFVWLALAGRGWGKSRSGGEWFDERARLSRKGDQLLLAGRTPSDVRNFALYGPGGLLTWHKDIEYQEGKRLLIWPNGAQAIIRSGANPEEFRGFSGQYAWLDELGAWDYPQECWDNLIFGMRERNPQLVITTTPRPIKVLKDIMAMEGTVVVKGSSHDNRANLSEKWIRLVLDPLAGTRLARQEIEAEMLDDVEGAIWSLANIDDNRVHREDVPEMKRIVIGVDPQGKKKIETDREKVAADAEAGFGRRTGIVAAGEGTDGHFYILADESLNGKPSEWGTKVVALYEDLKADKIVAEANFGGDMVESTVRTVSKTVSFGLVEASRGKRQRAEPVGSLYEQGKVHHVGVFAGLEDEMRSFTPDSKESPNRMDAMVWAVSELAFGVVKRKLTKATWGRG